MDLSEIRRIVDLMQPGRLDPLSWEVAEDWDRIFDEIPLITMAEKLRYWVQKQGFTVIPVDLAKKPLCRTWKIYQTKKTTEKEISEWGAHHKNAGIAVITGKGSNLTVLDADTPEALENVLVFLRDPALYPIIDTPNGGGHVWGLYTHELRQFQLTKIQRAKLPPEGKIDVRNDGGYALLPGSRAYLKDANGENANKTGQYKVRMAQSGKSQTEHFRGRAAFPPDLIEYLNKTIMKKLPATADLRQEAFAKPPEIIRIGQRNDMMFSRAWELVKGGKWPQRRVEEIILEANQIDCEPPLPEREVRTIIKSAYDRLKTHPETNISTSVHDGKEITFARRKCSDIEDTPVSWAWNGIVPMKMVTSINGDPGIGKTFVAADISARISQGAPFPVYQETSPPIKGSVIYISSEGVPETILKPRLKAAGADLTRIDIIEGVYLRKNEFSVLDIKKHLPQLEKECAKDRDLRLVVIDPIASFLPPSIDERASNQVRQAMDTIANFANKTGVAVVVVMHFNKDLSQRPVNRTSGSVQFMAAAKSSWAVAHKAGFPANHRFLMPQKSNLVPTEKSLPFTIQTVKYPSPKGEIETAKILYEGPAIIDVDEVISPHSQPAISMTARGRELLREQLREGRKLATELYQLAEERGIKKYVLWKAKEDLKVVDERSGYQGKSYWRMPDRGD